MKFLRRLPHPCIVRLVELSIAETADAMRDLIECHGDAMHEGAIIVVTINRLRIRPATSVERNDG